MGSDKISIIGCEIRDLFLVPSSGFSYIFFFLFIRSKLIYCIYLLVSRMYFKYKYFYCSERTELLEIEDNLYFRRLIDIANSDIICVITLILGDQSNSLDSTVFFGLHPLLVCILCFGINSSLHCCLVKG